MTTDFLFITAVTESECPEFNIFELDQVNENKFIAATYLDDQIVGVYIFRISSQHTNVMPLWTIWEEV